MKPRSNVVLGMSAAVAMCGLHLVQCARSEGLSSAELDSGVAEASAQTEPAEGGTFNTTTPLAPEDTECAETTKQIYVLATDRALYRFFPEKLAFVRVGQVACPTSEGTFSMAIDRHGTAWVEYTDGRIFAVDTTNASCKPTPFQTGQSGFDTFGMGYAMNDDGAGETLYVASAGLASLDTKSWQLTFRGSLTYGRTELTSLDKQLFAFSVNSGVIAALNKGNGATEKTYRTTAVAERAAFAFAQWGGDFWVFTGDSHSSVTQYSPADDKSAVVVQNTGMLIVGAGSSTCAPTKKGPQ